MNFVKDLVGNVSDIEVEIVPTFLVGEISSLLGNKDIFHNLGGKKSKKSEQISVFVE